MEVVSDHSFMENQTVNFFNVINSFSRPSKVTTGKNFWDKGYWHMGRTIVKSTSQSDLSFMENQAIDFVNVINSVSKPFKAFVENISFT